MYRQKNLLKFPKLTPNGTALQWKKPNLTWCKRQYLKNMCQMCIFKDFYLLISECFLFKASVRHFGLWIFWISIFELARNSTPARNSSFENFEFGSLSWLEIQLQLEIGFLKILNLVYINNSYCKVIRKIGKVSPEDANSFQSTAVEFSSCVNRSNFSGHCCEGYPGLIWLLWYKMIKIT
jgi:hypothetical protein